MQSVLLIGIAVSISLFTSVYAAPQNKNTKLNLNDLDINADGVISFLEFQESDKNGLSGLDLDMNGVLTLEEVLKSKPKLLTLKPSFNPDFFIGKYNELFPP